MGYTASPGAKHAHLKPQQAEISWDDEQGQINSLCQTIKQTKRRKETTHTNKQM